MGERISFKKVVFLVVLVTLGVCILVYRYGDAEKNFTLSTGNLVFFETESQEEYVKVLQTLDKSDILDISCGRYRAGKAGYFYKYTITYYETEKSITDNEILVLKTRSFEEYVKFIERDDIEIIDVSVAPMDAYGNNIYIITYQEA